MTAPQSINHHKINVNQHQSASTSINQHQPASINAKNLEKLLVAAAGVIITTSLHVGAKKFMWVRSELMNSDSCHCLASLRINQCILLVLLLGVTAAFSALRLFAPPPTPIFFRAPKKIPPPPQKKNIDPKTFCVFTRGPSKSVNHHDASSIHI